MLREAQNTSSQTDLRLPMRLVEEFVDAGRSPDEFTVAFTEHLSEVEAARLGKSHAIRNLRKRVRELKTAQGAS